MIQFRDVVESKRNKLIKVKKEMWRGVIIILSCSLVRKTAGISFLSVKHT